MAALRALLLDTGPLAAYLDRRDPAHEDVAARLAAFCGQLHTTSAVITEAMHFVAADFRGPALLAEFITASRALVHDLSQPAELRAAAALMAKYADTPMDYADATLLLLAERLAVLDVVTLDWRGFSVYRTRKGKALRIFNRS